MKIINYLAVLIVGIFLGMAAKWCQDARDQVRTIANRAFGISKSSELKQLSDECMNLIKSVGEKRWDEQSSFEDWAKLPPHILAMRPDWVNVELGQVTITFYGPLGRREGITCTTTGSIHMGGNIAIAGEEIYEVK